MSVVGGIMTRSIKNKGPDSEPDVTLKSTIKRREDPRPSWFLAYLKKHSDCDSMPDPDVLNEWEDE